MVDFKISYKNIDLELINKILNKNKKEINEINSTLINETSLNITKETNDILEINEIAKNFIKEKDHIVVLGIGGSNLGAKALLNILQGKYNKKIIFLDNIDPEEFNNSIAKIELNKTGFVIISKSGQTPETLSQFTSLIEIFMSQNNIQKLSENSIIITENNDNPLKKIANKINCKTLDHNKNIGGRYSVFSSVGLLPAALANLDILKIRQGALKIFSKLENESFDQHLIGAAIINYLHKNMSINLNVLITYASSLFFFGKWYLQLWSESIGKENKGITPIHSVGVTDQHSQLQLYLDGPKDKFFSLLTTDYRDQGPKMHNQTLEENNLNFLVGKKMGDLMFAEQKSTMETLINKKLPLREIFCAKINEFTIGQLMAYFIMETVATCHFVGVNPFNQPAVEYGKKLTKNYLLQSKKS
tara:strand:- start:301 stop:1551 length:1251 start_codon:yes stop_codon:yes gene_type:complete